MFWEGGQATTVQAPETPGVEAISCNPPSPRKRQLSTRLIDKVRIGTPYPALDEFSAVVREKGASGTFDVILAFHPITVEAAVTRTSLPVLADLIDEPALGAWRDFRASKGLVTRFRKGRHVIQLVRYLRAYMPRAFASVVVSKEDALSLRRLVPGVRVAVVPTGIDTSYFQPSGRPQEPDAVVFVGNFEGEPNGAGALFFAKDILPRLARLRPAVRWFVVGANPPASIRALADNPNVEVVGRVEDVRPWFERGVVVSPLVSGGGIKTKVLEAWSLARPVVATPLGCVGLPAVHGTNILVAKDAETFARMTAELLASPDLAARLGRKGRETVCRAFRWPDRASEIGALLQEAVAHGRA